MKWKPPSENSIDFKLILRFVSSRSDLKEPDYFVKPIFELHVWTGGLKYEFYDMMHVTDDEWEQCVSMLVQVARADVGLCSPE